MAQATRTVGPGTTIRDAKTASNVILAQGNVSANTTTAASSLQVDRPCLVNVELVVGTVAAGVTAFEIEVFGSDASNGTGNVVSYGRFQDITNADDNTTRVLAAQVYKPYMHVVMTHSGSGNANVGVFVRTPYDRRTDSTTA